MHWRLHARAHESMREFMHACMHCMSISQQEIRREFTCDNFYKHFKTSSITCSTHIDMLQLCFWMFFRCVSYIFSLLSMTSVWLSSQIALFRRLDIIFLPSFVSRSCFLAFYSKWISFRKACVLCVCKVGSFRSMLENAIRTCQLFCSIWYPCCSYFTVTPCVRQIFEIVSMGFTLFFRCGLIITSRTACRTKSFLWGHAAYGWTLSAFLKL